MTVLHHPRRRAVIYARYSTDKQRQESIADQIELCRRYAVQQGWDVVDTYTDAAISGASRHRPGFLKLVDDAGRRRFDVVVSEGIDRLGRRLADTSDLYDRLNFHNIKLYTPHLGEITTLHIAIMGMMAQVQLKETGQKTRRSHLGLAKEGRIPGGKAYGYDVVDGDKEGGGYRRINADEAAVVRRIFTLYADGMSPRAIARLLNDENVPGPRGRRWVDTTIRGQVARGTGILNNSNYVGVLEWGRCEFVKDPGTGKRVARINPQEKREIVEVPELRIIDDVLWNRVKVRQEAVATEIGRDEQGNALNRVHRRRFLLSGVLVCGVCGGRYTIMGKDRYGCAGHRNSGTCPNDRTISRQTIEGRVLAGLKERLLGADVVAAFVEEMVVAQRRDQAEARNRRGDQERALAGIDRKIASILEAVENGMYSPALKERLSALEAERATLAAEIGALGTEVPEMLLPANLPELYRRKIAELESVLGDGDEGMAAMEMIRSMVDRVVLSPCPSGAGLEAQLHGDLLAILEACAEADPKRRQPASLEAGCQLSVVAGAGFEPAAFRL